MKTLLGYYYCWPWHYTIVYIFTGMISWWVVYNGWRICATRPNDSNACEVFRVGATDEEDKEGATCACDAVGVR